MKTMSFSDGAILRIAWEKTKEHLGILIGVALLLLMAFGLYFIVWGLIGEDYTIVNILFLVAYIFAEIMIGIGLTRFALDIIDGRKLEMKTIFSGLDVFGNFIGAVVLYGLIVIGGYILFIIPGIIWGVKYQFAPWLVVDQGLTPFEALRVSSDMTDGLKWDLFAFHIIIQIVTMLGFFAFLIGAFVTIPLGMLANAAVYRHLSGKKSRK